MEIRCSQLNFKLFKIIPSDVCSADDKGSFIFGIFLPILPDIIKRSDSLGNRKTTNFRCYYSKVFHKFKKLPPIIVSNRFTEI